MKKNVVLLLAGLFGLTLSAQTNTFPASGNAGIGTTSPGTWFNDSPLLHIKGARPTISMNTTKAGGFATIQWVGPTDKTEFHMNYRDGKNSQLLISSQQDVKGVNRVIVMNGNGNVGFGVGNPAYRVHVDGQVHAVTYSAVTPPWSDFVFEDDYNLRSLESLERYIKENKHLPEIPGEAELKETGLNLPEMDAKLLQKIEELTLYMIEQHKKIEAQQKRIEKLEKKVAE